MTTELSLLPVEALTRRTDRFKCDALRAVITAGFCTKRHTAMHQGGRNQHAPPAQTPEFPGCASCKIGASVLALVGVEELPGCSVCGVPVKGVPKGKKPKCPAHRTKNGSV